MTSMPVSALTDSSFLERARHKLQQLESVRQAKLKALAWRKRIAVPIASVMTPILGFIDFWLLRIQSGDDSFAGLTVIGAVSLYAWVTQPKREYAKAYKQGMWPDIAGMFGEFTYKHDGKIPMESMNPSKIIPYHTSYKSEDLFTGTYRGVDIAFSEIRLTKRSNKQTVTVFDGLAILLSHGRRKFYGHTILTKDQHALGSWFKKQVTGLKRANMVDPEFEGLFDVYTNDQTEARYLIDPLIIEALKALFDEYTGNQLLAAFYEGHVLIMIESLKDHFEPASIDVPATNEQELLSMKREIQQIISIVDRLSLYDPTQRRRSDAKSKPS